ncbi:hypothetical protein ACI6PS_06500 [Flavobacterium sp. PLA-1-15]|uniref:hypothetical protein n=1 Tax=Flavobacterium sp. PLA-1-15 TaxID=3380533 RepID=UPI003B7F55DE
MKKINLLLGAAVVAVSFTSCKSEAEKNAEVTLDRYEKYVDSVSNIAAADAQANWESIDAAYDEQTSNAEAALVDAGDKTNAENRVEKAKSKYAELKAKMEAEAEKVAANNPANRKQALSSAYFKAGNIGENMDFSWVNKDNILKVYNDFYNEFEANKNTYSREDFDHIKAMYEALDAHKNKVEKEGLSSKDNLKIAELKLKFAPKFKWERMGAKAEENADAKE